MLDRDHWKAVLPFVQAFAEGKNVEFLSSGRWSKLTEASFMFPAEQYRMGVEPAKMFCVFVTTKDADGNEVRELRAFGTLEASQAYHTAITKAGGFNPSNIIMIAE